MFVWTPARISARVSVKFLWLIPEIPEHISVRMFSGVPREVAKQISGEFYEEIPLQIPSEFPPPEIRRFLRNSWKFSEETTGTIYEWISGEIPRKKSNVVHFGASVGAHGNLP